LAKGNSAEKGKIMTAAPQAQQSLADYSAYKFEGGYPTKDTIQHAYDEADLNRAIQAYRFFYPNEGYYTGSSSTNRVFLIVRSLPIKGDVKAALARIQTVKVQPLAPPAGWTQPTWTNVTEQSFDATPLQWETNLKFWEALHSIIDSEPVYEPFRNYYGELAALGIAKGKRFAPEAE
jgi:hypothetical protein